MDTQFQPVQPYRCTFIHFIVTERFFRILSSSNQNDLKLSKLLGDIRLPLFRSALDQETVLVNQFAMSLPYCLSIASIHESSIYVSFRFVLTLLGQRFALFEEKVIMSTLLRRFRFTYDTAKHGPAKPSADLVLKPHHGMPMILTPLVNDFFGSK